MPPQVYDWTCSACSLDWLKRAAVIDPASTREATVYQIGYTHNINPMYGLMSADGSALRAVLQDVYGVPTEWDWLSFDEAYKIFSKTPGMMSGVNWYHWVGVRGVQGTNLWIANSAPGYKGIYDILSREDYLRLGNMSVVWLV